jgi:hypothetical protein
MGVTSTGMAEGDIIATSISATAPAKVKRWLRLHHVLLHLFSTPLLLTLSPVAPCPALLAPRLTISENLEMLHRILMVLLKYTIQSKDFYYPKDANLHSRQSPGLLRRDRQFAD